jgi:hypothetical protein
MMAARRAELRLSFVVVEAELAVRMGCGSGNVWDEEGMLGRLEEKRFMRKLKIILTSMSRSQYSRSRARSSAMFVAGTAGVGDDVAASVSVGSSSIPHNDASL